MTNSRSTVAFCGRRVATVALVALLVSPHGARGDSHSDWEELMVLHEEAFRIMESESVEDSNRLSEIRQKRRFAFAEAVDLISKYRTAWIDDSDGVKYLLATFQMGIYSRYAEWIPVAIECFRVCADHPAAAQPDAVYQGDRIQVLVQELLREVSLLTDSDAAPSRRSPFWFDFKGKDPINFARLERLRPSPFETHEVDQLLNRVRFASDPEAAAAMEARLAELSLVRTVNQITQGDELTVFGVNGTRAETATLARRIEAMTQRLVKNYFDGPLPKRSLTVYANLHTLAEAEQPVSEQRQSYQRQEPPAPFVQQRQMRRAPEVSEEAVARALSVALHLREMSGLEGYFMPLDNSVVIRRGLLGGGGRTLFLGTPAHELAHALIQSDFPTVPEWLDEGLAALHEETEADGTPLGNYRLFVVRSAMNRGVLPSVRNLVEPGQPAWSDLRRPLMAASARYLCKFLFEMTRENGSRGLAEVYKSVRGAALAGQPKTSEDILVTVFQAPMDEIDDRFRAYVRAEDRSEVERKWGYPGPQLDQYIDQLAGM